MATLAVTRRFDLTDAQWAVLEPLLPAPTRSGRPSLFSKRQLIDGIRWRVRTGAPWRDVPACYGSWSAVYALFRRYQRDGIWQQIPTTLQALADAAGRITWNVSEHAAGARKRGIFKLSRPAAGAAPSRPITGWGVLVAG
ncbi:UNVERIFIED_ORG: transposase [Microbispora rosea subsp. rosea]